MDGVYNKRLVPLNGGKIGKLRVLGGWLTIEEFANETGLSEGTITNIEKGGHKSYMNTLQIIAKTLCVDFRELIDWPSEGTDSPAEESWEEPVNAILEIPKQTTRPFKSGKEFHDQLSSAIESKDELSLKYRDNKDVVLSSSELHVKMSSRDLVGLIAAYATSLLDELNILDVAAIRFRPAKLRAGLLEALSPTVEEETSYGSMFEPPNKQLAGIGGFGGRRRLIYRNPAYVITPEHAEEFAKLIACRRLLFIVLKINGIIVITRLQK